jgi:hypothetical protein
MVQEENPPDFIKDLRLLASLWVRHIEKPPLNPGGRLTLGMGQNCPKTALI